MCMCVFLYPYVRLCMCVSMYLCMCVRMYVRVQVREALDKIGEYHADRFKWKKAAQYFVQSRNFERLAEW